MCYETDCRRKDIFCHCLDGWHREHCAIDLYRTTYPNAPVDNLGNVITDNLPNCLPVYGPYEDLEDLDQHQRDMEHYCAIRGSPLIPDENE